MTVRIAGAWAFALAAVVAWGAAEPARAEIKKVATVEGITEYRLDNGLRVLLYPDPSRPKVTVNITVFVGSRHEGYGEAGMAHLLEHMVFKGTPTHPDIPGLMKEKGASFNGTTWVDRTNYYETLPASDENLEYAIKLEADRLVNSPIKAEDLASEFSVVRNEFESGENNPENILSQRITAAAYEWHNYGKSTIGNRADIERVPVDNLRAFYKKYYQADNALLIVAGNFDEKKALGLVEKYFGALPKPDRELPKTYTEEPAQDGERSVVLRRVGDVGAVGAAYHVPAGSHPDFPAVEILSYVLTDEPSGRLYKALVETKKATSVQSYAASFHDPGLLEMGARVNTKERSELQAVLDEMTKVAESVAETGVTAEEVDRARTQILNRYQRAEADPNSLAIQLSDWASQGDWRLYFVFRDLIEKVKPEHVQDVAAKYLRETNRTVGLFVPTNQAERTAVPAAPAIASLVDGYKGREVKSRGELLSTDPMELEKRVQRPEPMGGVEIALLPKETRGGLVSLNLRLNYGDAENLKGLADAPDLLGDMLSRGTKNLNRQQLQDALDKNFARVGIRSAGPGVLNVSVGTKRENLPVVLDLVRQMLREPSFPEAEFETLKAEQLAGLEQGRTEPMALAAIALQRQLSKFPPDDIRYVPTIDESVERLKAVTLDQVKKVYEQYLGSEHGQLAIVGDFEPSEVLPLLTPIFEGWKAEKSYARVERPFPAEIEAGRTSIVTPDKANAIYLAAQLIPIKDSDPDNVAMVVGNNILGGGALSSRIADRLRQKDGLSYGAGSMYQASAQDEFGQLIVNAIYNPTNVEKVAQGVDEEIARVLESGVTEQEVEKAKAGILQQRQVGRSNDSALAGALVGQLFNDRTFAFDAEEEAKIKALTPDQVNEVVRKRVDPKKLVIITAGDFSTEGSK